MATGLFQSSRQASGADEPLLDNAERYRAIGGTTIVSCLLAIVSPLSFVDWWLVVVPIMSIVLGLIAWCEIKRRSDELTGKPLALAAILFSSLAFVGSLTFLSIVYAAELPQGFQRLDYTMLQPLDGDPPTAVPDTAYAMDGTSVLLKGYIYPGSKQHGIVQFLLVRDQGDCCFGGNPKITDRVLVQMRDTQGIEFSPRLTKIAGRFSVRPTGTTALDGGVLYHLEDAVAR